MLLEDEVNGDNVDDQQNIRGGIKKKQFFFGVSPKRGEGGLAESKISLAEKTEIFLDFFGKRGGLTYSKRVLS